MIDALVFAAGLGTRLRPITDSLPKALVTVGGVTVLERAIRRIVDLAPGIVVVNAHHHAGQVVAEAERLTRLLEAEADSEGAPTPPRIVVSLESERPLETGGGLRRAASLLGSGRPVLLHNADVVTQLDLHGLVTAHEEEPGGGIENAVVRSPRLATLAVQDRDSSRKLLFDQEGLYGRLHSGPRGEERARQPRGPRRALAFSGVHVVSPDLIAGLPDEEVFSITDHYLDLAAAGGRIEAFDVGEAGWWEIGTPERLAAARKAFSTAPDRDGSPDQSSIGRDD